MVVEPHEVNEPDRAAAPRCSSNSDSFVGGTFRRYRRDLHRFLLGRLRNTEELDDLAERVYRRLMEVDEEKVDKIPMDYLYEIAASAIGDNRDVAQHLGEQLEVDSETVEEWSDQPSCVLPDDLAERLNLQQQLDKALALLPPTHAAVLLAHKRDGLSYEEVAEKLGLSPHTVEEYVTQAKARIRTMAWEC